MDKSLTAIIPVKANSARLPNKNLLPFGNSTLLGHKIEQLKQVSAITEIIVSSDSDEMLKIASDMKVTAQKRPLKYADESVPFGGFLEYICDNVPNSHILWACCTSPLVEPDLYEKAIKLYFEHLDKGFDSLITVLPYQSYLMDENGPINFKMGLEHKNSEQLPVIFHFTNGINIAPKDKIREWKYNYGPNAYRLKVNKREAADIDDIYDYICAKAMLSLRADALYVGE